MSSYMVTVTRSTVFGRHAAWWEVRVEPDLPPWIDQVAGLAAFITDGEWTCRPLPGDRAAEVLHRGHDRID